MCIELLEGNSFFWWGFLFMSGIFCSGRDSLFLFLGLSVSARVRAFFLHLVVSILIALCSLLLVFGFWYPAPLHEALGVTRIFFLLLMIDMAVGPLLTLLVYKKGKKTLLLDLTVIAFLQVSALVYGMWIMAEGRPGWIVFEGERFEVVQVVDIDGGDLLSASSEYKKLPWLGPQWVAADLPEDVKLRNNILFESLGGGSSVVQRPSLYRALPDVAAVLRQSARPLMLLSQYNDADRVRDVLQKWPEADAWLPLRARERSMVVLLNERSAEVIAIVELNPWN